MQVLQEPLGNLSAELRQRFAQIGAVWGRDINAHRDLVVNAYTPLVATAANDVADGCEVQREVSYGPHERQRLDRLADFWEGEIDHPLLQGDLNMPQLTLACGLLLEEWYPGLRWREGRPRLAAWADVYAARRSFVETQPQQKLEV